MYAVGKHEVQLWGSESLINATCLLCLYFYSLIRPKNLGWGWCESCLRPQDDIVSVVLPLHVLPSIQGSIYIVYVYGNIVILQKSWSLSVRNTRRGFPFDTWQQYIIRGYMCLLSHYLYHNMEECKNVWSLLHHASRTAIGCNTHTANGDNMLLAHLQQQANSHGLS